MNLIGMNVDLVEALANAFSLQAGDIRTHLTTLTGAVDGLLSTWQGNSRTTFENEWSPWVNQVTSLIEEMESIQKRLNTTTTNFRTIDCF